MMEGRWSQRYLFAIGSKPSSKETKEIESHLKELFVIKGTTYYKFDDESYVSLTKRGNYFQVFEINEEKYEKKKKEAKRIVNTIIKNPLNSDSMEQVENQRSPIRELNEKVKE